VTLLNGDICSTGQWVLVGHGEERVPSVARVHEIIQRKGSPAANSSRPDAILVETGSLQGTAQSYRMPVVEPQDSWLVLPIEVSYFHCVSESLKVWF
jgi:hypothetical protein